MSEDLNKNSKKYAEFEEMCDSICDSQIPLFFPNYNCDDKNTLRVLSLFSGCGGMDLGFEGDFLAHKLSFEKNNPHIITHDGDWVRTRKTRFKTVFANDIDSLDNLYAAFWLWRGSIL